MYFITVLFDYNKLYDIVHYTIDLGLHLLFISSNLYTLLVLSFVIITTICSRKILHILQKKDVPLHLKEDTPGLFFFVASIEFIKNNWI